MAIAHSMLKDTDSIPTPLKHEADISVIHCPIPRWRLAPERAQLA